MTRSFDHVAPASSLVTKPIEYGWTSARLPCGRRLQARMMRPEGSCANSALANPTKMRFVPEPASKRGTTVRGGVHSFVSALKRMVMLPPRE